MRIVLVASMFSAWLTLASTAMAQQPPEPFPNVIQHAEPTYPPLAHQASIQGEVRVKITTDGESVRDAEAVSGHPLLRKTAEENVRTWKFAPHRARVFEVIFRYKLLSSDVDVEFLDSPGIIEVKARPTQIIIQWAWISLGTWNAQLKSAHGELRQVLKLAYSGPDGDWLKGDASLGPGDQAEEIDFGHKERDFLAFTLTVNEPDGHRVQTFLVGRMTGDKIVGTFVDDEGRTGKWKAVRVSREA